MLGAIDMTENSLEKHYNRIYSETDTAFGGEKGVPAAFIVKLGEYLKKGKILELGAGQGRNSIWLARHGLEVDALELSDKGVADMAARAEKEGLAVRARKADVRDGLQGEYDAVVSTYMTHHLSRDEALHVVDAMKSHTKPGGFNVLEVFTKEGDFFKDRPDTDRFYPTLGELRALYGDWDVLEYEEKDSTARQTKEDGSRMQNIAARIIARRTS